METVIEQGAIADPARKSGWILTRFPSLTEAGNLRKYGEIAAG